MSVRDKLKGKSIKDLTNISIDTFNKMGESELRNVVQRLASAGNKRLNRFQRAGESSPATNYIQQSGGKFSTKGKGLNQLRSEYSRLKDFLSSKTSTRTGWREVKKETAESLREMGVDVKPKDLDNLFRTYEKLKQIDPSITNKALKYTVLREISQMPDDLDPEERAAELQGRLTELYEEQEAINAEFFSGVSEFFE